MFKQKFIPFKNEEEVSSFLRLYAKHGQPNGAASMSLLDGLIYDLMIATPQYTLVISLETICGAMYAKKLERYWSSMAVGMGVNVDFPPLSLSYLKAIGELFIRTRPNLSAEDRQSIQQSWDSKLENRPELFERYTDALLCWSNDIISEVQRYEFNYAGDNDSAETEESPIEEIISDNSNLFSFYREYKRLYMIKD